MKLLTKQNHLLFILGVNHFHVMFCGQFAAMLQSLFTILPDFEIWLKLAELAGELPASCEKDLWLRCFDGDGARDLLHFCFIN